MGGMMDPQLKKRWLDDMRAHPELKGCGALRSHHHTMKKAGEPTKYCCLGRLLIVAGREEEIDYLQNALSIEELTGTLLVELGVHFTTMSHLIDLNDDGGGAYTNDDDFIVPAPDYSEVIDYIDAEM
jgi:hypothetical protein